MGDTVELQASPVVSPVSGGVDAGVALVAVGLITELCRTANIIRTHLDRAVLRGEGLRWTAFDVLQLVCQRRHIETRLVAAELGIAKATVTGIAVDLTRRGLIRRLRHPQDHRRVILRPTPSGWKLAIRIRGLIAAEETRLLHDSTLLAAAPAAIMLQRLATAGGTPRPGRDGICRAESMSDRGVG